MNLKMPLLKRDRAFPCPICNTPLDVRESKKDEPYVVCDYCGIQMFVRNPAGIRAFRRQVESADRKGVWETISEMERRYRKQCPDCGCKFWVEPSQIETNWFDGKFMGYRCPQDGCKGIVKEELAK